MSKTLSTDDSSTERPTKRPRVDFLNKNSPEESLKGTRTGVDEDDEEELGEVLEENAPKASDLYLDTINRAVLDFDFEARKKLLCIRALDPR